VGSLAPPWRLRSRTGGRPGTQGRRPLCLADGELEGILAAADTLRPEVPAALEAVPGWGFAYQLLTGDNDTRRPALAEVAGRLYAQPVARGQNPDREGLQAQRAAPSSMWRRGERRAGAGQADVGCRWGHGSDVALEAAHVALMREDWVWWPISSHRPPHMRTVKVNLGFTRSTTWWG